MIRHMRHAIRPEIRAALYNTGERVENFTLFMNRVISAEASAAMPAAGATRNAKRNRFRDTSPSRFSTHRESALLLGTCQEYTLAPCLISMWRIRIFTQYLCRLTFSRYSDVIGHDFWETTTYPMNSKPWRTSKFGCTNDTTWYSKQKIRTASKR